MSREYVCMWVMKFASGLAHACMCNRGQLSTTLCARQYAHTPPCRPVPYQGLPYCATCCHVVSLTCSSGADGRWARRREQLWSWMADPTHLGATEPTSDNLKNCVCALGLNIQLKYYQNHNMAKCNIQMFDKCVITCHLK